MSWSVSYSPKRQQLVIYNQSGVLERIDVDEDFFADFDVWELKEYVKQYHADLLIDLGIEE